MRAATPRLLFAAALLLAALPLRAQSVFVNEIHYDNDGGDSNEGVEVAGPAGTDLSSYALLFYTANGTQYDSLALSGTLPDQQNGYGTAFFLRASIQNGPSDGIALRDGSGVIQFLSYEGVLTASEGGATGMTSTNIGVFETDDPPLNRSLQLIGSGNEYGDFTWSGPIAATSGAVNTGQVFVAPVVIATEKISPILDSLVTNCDGTYTAFFGYLNRNASTVTIPTGSDNRFSPAPEDRGQTTDFLAGRQRKVFSVDFPGGNLVWTLRSPNGQQSTATAGPGAALPPQGCGCADPSAAPPSYAGGYVLNGNQTRAAIQTSTPAGGLVFEFYNTTNLAIEAPEIFDTSNPPGFTRSGDTFTFEASTPSPEILFFPITRADPNVARVSFFLRITDACGRTVDVDPSFAVTDILGDEAAGFSLAQAAPSPTTGAAKISYSLAEAGDVTLAVYDVLGREVARLVDGSMAAGSHEATFDGANLPSGLYLYRLTANGQMLQQTLTVAR